MRDPKRIDKIMKRLTKVWKKYPDLRLVQLILNVVSDPTAYYMEDEELIKRVEALYQGRGV